MSRIPVSNRRQSADSAFSSSGHSRSPSALSNPPLSRQRLTKSPTDQPKGNETPIPPTPRSRYHPPPITTTPNGQSLSAKIVAPIPKVSPPLRSSRPRQPVSSATTSASRARAAERFQGPATKDGRRPSEQWLGKPYDPQQAKRNIPKLGKIDFAERRARIQKAISQNLEESRSEEILRKGSQSTQASQDQEDHTSAGAEDGALNSADQRQAEEMDRETDTIPGQWPTPGALSVDTFNVPAQADREPEPDTAYTADTAQTEFEVEESPVLGRPPTQEALPEGGALQGPALLTSATYQPPATRARAPDPVIPLHEAPREHVQSPSVLDNVMQMRQRSSTRGSRSDTDYADDSAPASAEDSPSDIEDRWGLERSNTERSNAGLQSVLGSIKIMLDDNKNRHDELYAPGEEPSNSAINRAIEQYQSHGTLTPALIEEMQRHMVDLQRASANEGSNGFMIQNLLDSIIDVQRNQEDDQNEPDEEPQQSEEQSQELLPSVSYEMPSVTPDTPPGWQYTEESGTAVVYTDGDSHQVSPVEEDDDNFHVKIQRADEAWERQQRGDPLYLRIGDNDAPLPPPKDVGYTPRSSTGPPSATFPPDLKGLRISTTGGLQLPEIHSGNDSLDTPLLEQQVVSPKSNPPLPSHAPPPPPPLGSSTRLPSGVGELPPQMPATYSERGSSEISPRVRKSLWGPSGSSRPSIDSQRAPSGIPPPVPASVSMTSFTDTTSIDDANSTTKRVSSEKTRTKASSLGPDQKRLSKRRHITKELLDTENSYHQDLKIIEDIYRATAVPDLISPEDKKVLFGNCDDIERFSLHFYDELRKAVAPVYVPAKDKRWMNRRGSYSTTESGEKGQASATSTPDGIDDEKDRATTIGQAFLDNFQTMEQVYSTYLKNHDAANQRLSALRNTPTVKCWLDECHNNASDITSAWDLDSLLVKPTQRVAKYPMLLQQLLETTPQDHPDREAIKTAANESISMLTRINEAKKRADLVDQIVNRKRKESDVRSGIAKAFGRRTEKLKERVGIAEAFQDPDFDELAHKFGGHFIRLQICMRDVQHYMDRIAQAMDQIANYAGAFDMFTDVSVSSGSEQESKWRQYGQCIRDLTGTAFREHREAVQKRVIAPMVACIKAHKGPESAIAKRKNRIVDYAKCKAIEKRGEKPDKKIVELADQYEALNETLKDELPHLYEKTAVLVQSCLGCFLQIQRTWYHTWERKLGPILEANDVPASIQQIEPAFRADFDMVKGDLNMLGICNGAVLANAANFLSPVTTFESENGSSSKRPSTLDSSKRTMSVGSDSSPMPGSAAFKRRSSGYVPVVDTLESPNTGRFRSNSAMSAKGSPTQTPGSALFANRPWSNGTAGTANTPKSSFTQSRPATATQQPTQTPAPVPPRLSAEQARSPRPASGATYFTARPEPEEARFSGIFNSAMPPDTPDQTQPDSPQTAPSNMPALFVCASLFEFSIDKTRKEGGYPYLTYVQGEVFDVVATKGELWLAKNQDDSTNTLGWIWEQHFVTLSMD